MNVVSQRKVEGESFFRPEFVIASRDSFGAPIGLQTVRFWVILLFFSLFVITLLVFLFFVPYSRKETVQGQVRPVSGLPQIVAIRSGIATEVFVDEGTIVVAGQKLMSISSTPSLEGGETLSSGLGKNHTSQIEANRDQLKFRLMQLMQTRRSLSVRRQALSLDIDDQRRSLSLQEQRIELQKEAVAAMRKLAKEGLIPVLTLKAKEDALLAEEITLSNLQRSISQQVAAFNELEVQISKLDADDKTLRSENATVRAQLEEKLLNIKGAYSNIATTPIDGIVTNLLVKQGSSISAGQPLAVIIPESSSERLDSLEVELWVSSRAIAFVTPGTEARLMYDSFPYQHFGVSKGVVKSVARAPILTNEFISGHTSKEPMYQVRVAISENSILAYGKKWPLVPGMAVSADLILEDRKLVEWLFEPLFAFKR